MENWKVGEWYYVVLSDKYPHMFKYNGETEERILLGNTHWSLWNEAPSNDRANNFQKFNLTFAKRVTEKEALLLQSGVKFENLPKRNVYALWD